MKVYLPRCSCWVVVLMACLAFSAPYVALAQQSEQNEFFKGKADGQRDAKGNALWILGGFGCSCLGVLGAYVFKPSPPTAALVGKSSDYVLGYTDGYKSKGRNQNVLYALAGWAAAIAVSVALTSSAE